MRRHPDIMVLWLLLQESITYPQALQVSALLVSCYFR